MSGAREAEAVLADARRDIEMTVLPMDRLLGFVGFVLGERVGLNPDLGSAFRVGVEGADAALFVDAERNAAGCKLSAI
jgi:hypothetical protein